MDWVTIALSLGIPAALALITPILTAKVKVRIDEENRKRAIARIDDDPLINVGSFFERIDFAGKEGAIGPSYISKITDRYIQVTEWVTGNLTSFEGEEFARVQYWNMPNPKTHRPCNLENPSDRQFITMKFGKRGPREDLYNK